MEFKSLDETDFKLHPLAHPTGGIYMKDPGNLIPAAVKELVSRIASKAIQGNLNDVIGMPAPAKIHSYTTTLHLQANDMLYCKYLTLAAQQNDPLERMKLIVPYYIAALWYNPALLGCRVQINPILGETLQREMPTGERIYCE